MIPHGRIIMSDDVLQLPRNKSTKFTESFEVGGKALMDSSEGLLVRNYQAYTDGNHVYFKPEDEETWVTVLSDTGITEIDITFDQQMRLHVAYVSDGTSKFYMFDVDESKQVIREYPGIRNIRISLDDKRKDVGAGGSDIIVAYIRNDTNELCYRVQRERYLQEHRSEVVLDPTDILWKIGMGNNNAFLFYIMKGGISNE